jgi:hypothetical protein
MTTPYFRSPTSLPIAAAIVPARFAEQHDQVLWRALPTGEIEVAARSGARVERVHVHRDGSTIPAGTSTRHTRLLEALLFGGLAIGAASVLVLVDSDYKWFCTFFVLLLAASGAHAWTQDLTRHLKRELGAAYTWHEPTKLHGWTPRTSAQLAAVEQLATDYGGTASVTEGSGATIEVVAGRRRWVLDADGNVVLQEKNRFRPMSRDDNLTWIEICTYVADGG